MSHLIQSDDCLLVGKCQGNTGAGVGVGAGVGSGAGADAGAGVMKKKIGGEVGINQIDTTNLSK